jgi:phospho-N-acetylmuramoyl-pentapeptide-transferase
VTWSQATVSGLLVLFLMTGLGLVGFLDDYIKVSKQRSLGLRAWAKLGGQMVVAVVFAILAVNFPDFPTDFTPASTEISFIRDTGLVLGPIVFVVWAYIMIAGTSNGVNLADGLDGLATGTSVMVFGSYVLMGIWQFNQNCAFGESPKCYEVRDPLDLAVVAAAIMGACFGFLWWNASPAKIFMGDTGSLALGGALAGLAITTRTELLLVLVGGLFVLIALSVILQVGFFKLTGKRVFRMAPLQHHFELVGWGEVTIVIRFWIIAGLLVALGLGVFYAEWVASVG